MTLADRNKARPAIDPIVPVAVVAGVALWFITDTLSKTNIGGPGWTLKGNGSIAVLFAGGGALVAFGWLALAFGARGERGYLNRALIGAVAVFALETVFVFAPIALAPMFAAAYLPPLIALSLAAALAVGIALAHGGALAGVAVAVVALAASLAPLGLQFYLVPLFLPVVIAVPSLSRSANGWLALNSLAVLVALLLGLYGAQALASR